MLLEEEKPRRRNALLWAGLGLLIASISATLSATITINTDNRVEFGQGVKYLNACDDWVQIVPRTGTGDELDYVKYIDIKGLDTSRCKSVNVAISMYTTGAGEPLSIFSLPTQPTTCAEATGGDSTSPSGQDSTKACDGSTSTKYLRQFYNYETPTVNMTLSAAEEIRALDFIGGADDDSFTGRRIWKAELLQCSSASFSSCTSLGTKAQSWTGFSGSTNSARYPLRPFWTYAAHSKSQYFQLKMVPWSKSTGSYDFACRRHCVQVAEILPLASRAQLTILVDSSGSAYINKSGSSTPSSSDVVSIANNSDRLNIDYSAGIYTITLDFPIALATAVNTITVQSSSASNPT